MFMTRDTMVRHLQTHVNEKPYECGQCDQKFKRKLQLKQHLFHHTGEFPYKCLNCDKGFTNKRALRHHHTSHVVKLHRCSSCTKDFTKWSDLVSHRKIEHIAEYQCRVCLKTFYSKKNLQQHVPIHKPKDEQQVLTCPHERCPKFFFHEKNLRTHIRSKHEGKRKFQCAACDRQLSTKQKLLHHLKLHICSLNNVKLPRSRRGSTAAKPRCDTGVPKVSNASRLAGVVLSHEAEKLLVGGQGELVEVEVAEN
jgi:aspartate carbamoyltransferase regulatory subunit